jgi:hypothetical protein
LACLLEEDFIYSCCSTDDEFAEDSISEQPQPACDDDYEFPLIANLSSVHDGQEEWQEIPRENLIHPEP